MSGAITFNPPTIADQTFTVDTPITPLQLPVATGGTPPYTYTLSPIPDGLAILIQKRSSLPAPPPQPVPPTQHTPLQIQQATLPTLRFTIAVVTELADDPLDVNSDGQVTVVDLAIVALFYGTRVPAGMGSLPADVNADGVVNLMDITLVAQGIDAAGGNLGQLSLAEIEAALVAAAEQAEDIEAIAAAPNALSGGNLTYHNVAAALADAKQLTATDTHLENGVPVVLETLLQLLTEMKARPETSALLPNYPNPFNPETWIPYHLAKAANVTLTIYDVRGVSVRTLTVGHQPAGVYETRHRAAYWDGKNQIGEPVASGLYFYTLTAGDFTATRKLLIAK